MFSNTAEYALRAVVHLATHSQAACTAQEIAASTKVPAGYLAKLLQDLARAHIVSGQRGPNGGFTLLRSPAELSVLEVINAVDSIERIRQCPLGIPSHGTKLCRLHQQLDDAIASVESLLGNASIADMIHPTKSGTRCLFPSPSPQPVTLTTRAGPRR